MKQIIDFFVNVGVSIRAIARLVSDARWNRIPRDENIRADRKRDVSLDD